MVVETSRRTIFLCNIVNFFSNREHETGLQSPYYEPLDDELILNMPLPCSHVLWTARTEDGWRQAVMQSEVPSPAATKGINNLKPLGFDSGSFTSPQISLKYLLTNYTPDYLIAYFGRSFGFRNSDELRRLIILCALEQFSGRDFTNPIS